MNPELSAWESGLERFVSLDKGDFIGRAALVARQKQGTARRIATLSIDTDGASAFAFEGVYREGALVGHVTSSGYSYTFGHDIALALLPLDLGLPGTELEVSILGERRAAKVIADSPFDPEGARGRM